MHCDPSAMNQPLTSTCPASRFRALRLSRSRSRSRLGTTTKAPRAFPATWLSEKLPVASCSMHVCVCVCACRVHGVRLGAKIGDACGDERGWESSRVQGPADPPTHNSCPAPLLPSSPSCSFVSSCLPLLPLLLSRTCRLTPQSPFPDTPQEDISTPAPDRTNTPLKALRSREQLSSRATVGRPCRT